MKLFNTNNYNKTVGMYGKYVLCMLRNFFCVFVIYRKNVQKQFARIKRPGFKKRKKFKNLVKNV